MKSFVDTYPTAALERDQSIFVLADDLTGAADAANYFRDERRRVRVTFTEDAPWDFNLRANVVQVYDTESRALAPDEARHRIDQAASPLAGRFASARFFKTGLDRLGMAVLFTIRQCGTANDKFVPTIQFTLRRAGMFRALLLTGRPKGH